MASDQQNEGLADCSVVIDRDTASRLGITPQMIDDALYDAFGQRQISIMFTQLNQYRVVLEVKPEFRRQPAGPRQHLHPLATGGQGATEHVHARRANRTVPLVDQPPGTVPGGDRLLQSRAGRLAGRRGRRPIEAAKDELGLPPSIQASFQGTAQAFQASLRNEPLLILAALVTVYIVLGVLYESYIHPITILSTLPSAGVGRPAGAAALPASI